VSANQIHLISHSYHTIDTICTTCTHEKKNKIQIYESSKKIKPLYEKKMKYEKGEKKKRMKNEN